MPSTYESLGVKFLYPDNWTVANRDAAEGISGVTFELPSGGFFSIERVDRDRADQDTENGADQDTDLDQEEEFNRAASEQKLIDAVKSSIAADYGEVEQEELPCETEGDRAVEFSFYYLDLVILSRLLMTTINDQRFIVQFQAESRAFEENELVFAAILKQLEGAV